MTVRVMEFGLKSKLVSLKERDVINNMLYTDFNGNK